MKHFSSLLLLTLCTTALTACSGSDNSATVQKKDIGMQQIALVSPQGEVVQLTVEVADEADEQKTGLQHRESLADGTGMLFLFQEDAILTFWMKDTLIPLDIIFFDSQGKWVSHGNMQPCTADPCSRYSSGNEARIALEVNQGFIGRTKIGPGWRIALPDKS